MKNILLLILLLIGPMTSSVIVHPLAGQSITDEPFLDEIIIALLEAGMLDERYNQGTETGGEICKAGGGSLCYSDISIGSGICKAGGGSLCYSDISIAEGISRLPQSNRRATADTQWAWDEINHPTGRMWRCRGIQTGQFAPDYQCSGLPKVDYRWPGEGED